MRIAKLLMLCTLLTLAAAESRADTAALQPIEFTMQSPAGATLDGSTTIGAPYSPSGPGTKYSSAIYGRITITSCTWYRPCTQPPPEPIVISTQAEQITTAHVPEPASLALFGSGLIGIGVVVRRKLQMRRG